MDDKDFLKNGRFLNLVKSVTSQPMHGGDSTKVGNPVLLNIKN